MIGRANMVAALGNQLPERRFVTIVGPGGIGKTTVALAAATTFRGRYRHGVWFVDLAPVAEGSRVPSALASVLRIATKPDDPVASLVSFLKDKEMLLVVDSCEHVVHAAALLCEAAFSNAPGVHILATSREPLRASGERVQRLPALPYPPTSAHLRAAEAMAFPAVELCPARRFCRRAARFSSMLI